MKKRHYLFGVLLGIGILSFSSSCVSVKSYEKMYLNDEDMQLNNRKIMSGEQNFQTYREGAAGGTSGKTGGGCGCN